MLKIKRILLVFALFLLVITRFLNISWGLPYPFHPDERNMAVAVTELNCKISFGRFNLKDCFNPHFYAYGQFPLYSAFLLGKAAQLVRHEFSSRLNLEEAILALRILSATASILNAFIIYKLLYCLFLDQEKNSPIGPLVFIPIIFSPFFIQFSHFGTTESILMLSYTAIVYLSIQLVSKEKINHIQIVQLAACIGISLATKISAVGFIPVPVLAVLLIRQSWLTRLGSLVLLGLYSFLVFSVASPHVFLSYSEFRSAIQYETEVAIGKSVPFYTKQFLLSEPIIFQLTKVFPYVFGWPMFAAVASGFLFLPRQRNFFILKFGILFYFLLSAFIYAKWTRFLTPIYPLALVIGIGAILRFFSRLPRRVAPVVILTAFLLVSIPGLAFLSVYAHADVRFTASEKMKDLLPSSVMVLSETANVVDIPFKRPARFISFNFYELEDSPGRQKELAEDIAEADFIIVPSRRVFANFTCFFGNVGYEKSRCLRLTKDYPHVGRYYQDLFSGRLGFRLIAKFSSFPKLELLGKTVYEMNDEAAEETFTVFDHPVIRVYEKAERRLKKST
ncbi:glycosyltransferase family 39 protein [Candidatus Roizmanbacteria bacterium]|nr:glycosyltransferase family 39 protein [Candidatus Roizmanbacteria bacterium]